ncbi:MFS transporter [Streptomyces phaeochromogenes]|uniref:MFS transporter n=1 Tax=Streptomyces phaeochromogenes TaxID=1923 RepID=A0ABZ1HVA8_STRPH|nr:Cmx/CmrA family chloramphenicol efflux MFS transporter [Streptomyces phaeochromogenes]MCX5603604.1 MFS transporter [Streptomyces phaeochromogenes]WSD21648.1 MFS transporter [Streptomyces phaeochromogenes]WSJ11724.1 MFS transporter [Streptomyces phaeochromogenes]
MPLAVYVLGLSVFALGTSEFMLSGLLPAVADDMNVSIPRAGLLISAFAVGMVVGAPLLAVATLRMPRRTTLISLIAVFGVGQIAGALAPNYAVLFASRVVSALACAGFWAVGAAVAIAMVPVNARARALAVMIGGLSIANVLGVPAGAFLGESLGWRSAFWAVGAASAVALVGVATLIPRIPLPDEKPQLRRELRIYRDRQVWLSISLIAFAAGGVFCAFSYLAPLLTDVSGLDDSWVPVVLGLFGVGALIGTMIGGRIADAHLFGVLLSGIAASSVLLVALALLGQYAVAAVTLAFLLGVSAFYTAPALNARMFNVAGKAPTLAGATTTAAFNLGNTGGPWIGGAVIDAGLGFASPAWAGAALTVTAGAVTAVSLRLHRRTAASRVVTAGAPAASATTAASTAATAANEPINQSRSAN